tara:strand:- start:2940 stop:3461 length:522 start_codon:yes stop_codon:yes gene_type:complete
MFSYTSLGFGSGGVATSSSSSSVSAPSAPFFTDANGQGSANGSFGSWQDWFLPQYGPSSINHNFTFQQPAVITPPNAGPSPIEFVDFILNFNVTSTPTPSIQYSVVTTNNNQSGQPLVVGVTFSAATSKACVVRFELDPLHQSNDLYEGIIRVVSANAGGSITYQEPVALLIQ